MKPISICLIVIGLLFHVSSFSQIKSVTLQANGLTCSMCSRAIYKSLQKVDNVAGVQEDIEHSSYQIRFQDPANVSLQNLKKAVLDAGFSVAWMEVSTDFHDAPVATDSSLQVDRNLFYFVGIRSQVLNGEHKLIILNKDYISDAERKKYQKPSGTDSDGSRFQVTLAKS